MPGPRRKRSACAEKGGRGPTSRKKKRAESLFARLVGFSVGGGGRERRHLEMFVIANKELPKEKNRENK